MKQTLRVVFGKEQIAKIYNNEILSDEEIKLNVKKYQFKSEEEKQAFIRGLNEAIGWVDFCIPEFEMLN